MTVRKQSNARTQRSTVQLHPSQSYTPQSADLLRLPIELMTLDISGMGYGKIACRVA